MEKALFGEQRPIEQFPEGVLPDFPVLHAQLQQHRHRTLQLAWEEYRQKHPALGTICIARNPHAVNTQQIWRLQPRLAPHGDSQAGSVEK